nr:hypothetical protein [Allomuricauda sp.]
MKSLNRIVFVPIAIICVLGCSSSSSNGDDNPPTDDDGPITSVSPPTAASLVFPEDNTECNEGEIINETTSTVTFRWTASENTDTYTVSLTNLNTNETSTTSATTNEAPINLERGAPYEWFVISRANGSSETATSLAFRFYNEGPGVENYPPFPAEAVNPKRGENLNAATTNVRLEWSTSDIDGDVEAYEVFFGTDSASIPSLGTTNENSFSDILVTSGGTYFWYVISTDDQANSSTSEIFQFRVR